MFTGIITDVGRLSDRIESPSQDLRLVIETQFPTEEIDIGASIACSGACLTVVEKGSDWLAFDASAETCRLTTLGSWTVGRRINLERALRLGDELGGHMVSGHIDGVGMAVSAVPVDGSVVWGFEVPTDFARYVAPKGSIALDGVSLTVNRVEGARFEVNIIPHTQSQTTFAELKPGDPVNFEIDLIARYVARLAGQS
jgi:riboflavin synthase